MSGALVIRADARELPLADSSVDLIVTSPPFHNLRDYGVPGQIGNEPSRDLFLDQLWQVTAECMRVMKPTASLFVELGDSYSDKSLNLAPQRYAIGCTDKLGLLLRAEIIWDRPNGLPESVRDRVRLSHSRWWHLTKGPRYYSAIDELRAPHAAKTLTHRGGGQAWGQDSNPDNNWAGNRQVREVNPLGALPGSVWSVPSEPLRLPPWLGVDHYAAFPSEWPRRLILGWSPPGICVECGQGQVPVVDRQYQRKRDGGSKGLGPKDLLEPRGRENGTGWSGKPSLELTSTILGYACACTPHTDHPGTGGGDWGSYDEAGLSGAPAANGKRHVPGNYKPKTGPWREYHLDGWRPPPTRPALVLDPFGGTGTVGMVARALGRDAISLDLSGDYCRASRWRIFHSGNAGKALARTNTERQGTLL